MQTVFVKCGEDRVAYADEAGKKPIPADTYIPVKLTPWIEKRLACGDIVQRPESAAAAPPEAGDASQSPKRSRSSQ